MSNGPAVDNWMALLRKALEEDKGQSFALEPRNLNRIWLEAEGDDSVEFTLERHPHILGRETVGELSSGYFPVEQRFRFILSTGELKLVSEEHGLPVVDWIALCAEDVTVDVIPYEVEREMSSRPDRNKIELVARCLFLA